MASEKVRVMSLDFADQLARCPTALHPAFQELHQLFWPGYRYRRAPSADVAEQAALQFVEICHRHLQDLQPEQGLSRGSVKTPPAASQGPPTSLSAHHRSSGSSVSRTGAAPAVRLHLPPQHKFLGNRLWLGPCRLVRGMPTAFGLART